MKIIIEIHFVYVNVVIMFFFLLYALTRRGSAKFLKRTNPDPRSWKLVDSRQLCLILSIHFCNLNKTNKNLKICRVH